MITCAKCGRDNEDHYKFCLGCGSSLAAQAPAAKPSDSVACPQCSAQITAGQRFCATCGCRVPEVAASSQSMTPSEAVQPSDNAASSTQHGNAPAANAPANAPASVAPPVDPLVDAAPAAAAASQEPVAVHAAAVDPQAPASPQSTPAPNVVGKLVMVNPDGSTGDVHPLVAGDNIVGRQSDAAVFQRDEFLSPQHANFRVENGEVLIRDLNSVNGVYVRIAAPTEIFPGDHIRIGQEILRFEALADFQTVVSPNADRTTVAGGQIGDVWGRLARISGPEFEASTAFVLFQNEHVIGRERGDFTFRDDGFVSGTHARVFRADGRYYVEDLKSSNGTYLRVRGEHSVPNGTLLLMGRQPFRVHIGG